MGALIWIEYLKSFDRPENVIEAMNLQNALFLPRESTYYKVAALRQSPVSQMTTLGRLRCQSIIFRSS